MIIVFNHSSTWWNVVVAEEIENFRSGLGIENLFNVWVCWPEEIFRCLFSSIFCTDGNLTDSKRQHGKNSKNISIVETSFHKRSQHITLSVSSSLTTISLNVRRPLLRLLIDRIPGKLKIFFFFFYFLSKRNDF